jgi:hypothetical protein
MSLFGWVNVSTWGGIDLAKFPNVKAWHERILARPAVQRGLTVPGGAPSRVSNSELQRRVTEGDDDAKKQLEEDRKFIDAAKEKYGYKYSSP